MIHVCFALTDKSGRYAKFTGTTLASIFDNTSAQVTAHVLHDATLTADNRDKLSRLAGRNQRVEFYNVDELCSDKITEIKNLLPDAQASHFSLATTYRLLLPQILPQSLKKIIYLDSDIIVNLDIAELWRVELDEKIFAAVPEIFSEVEGVDGMKKNFPLCRDGLVDAHDYFNAGVLLMNVARLRAQTETLLGGFAVISQDPIYCCYPDQDLLNCCFSTQIIKLPTKFNRFTRNARWDGEVPQEKIYHYAGSSFGLGLGLDAKDPFNRLWLEYFSRTPWFDVLTIGRLFDEFQRRQDALKRQLMNLSTLLPRRKRVFYVPRQNLQALTIFFDVRGDEEIILSDEQGSLETLFAEMKRSRGQKVFFLMEQYSKHLRELLTQAGFTPNEDFFDGFEFLTQAQGVPFNSYPFAAAM